ncbi:urease accessory UreF family protein [Amycolatopsis sp. NPDC051373]|uniref:urease accessory UreF family protein n=1 Tax=Amycolatopsis sp. NPDC051373 TaxID=3155801 RepID=UPI00344E5712
MTASIAALLLADGRLPVGGHAHSAGLEPAVNAGLSAYGVPDYLRARLMTVGRMEAAATVLSHRWARSAGTADGAGLRTLQDELLARTPSAPMREASVSWAGAWRGSWSACGPTRMPCGGCGRWTVHRNDRSRSA